MKAKRLWSSCVQENHSDWWWEFWALSWQCKHDFAYPLFFLFPYENENVREETFSAASSLISSSWGTLSTPFVTTLNIKLQLVWSVVGKVVVASVGSWVVSLEKGEKSEDESIYTDILQPVREHQRRRRHLFWWPVVPVRNKKVLRKILSSSTLREISYEVFSPLLVHSKGRRWRGCR